MKRNNMGTWVLQVVVALAALATAPAHAADGDFVWSKAMGGTGFHEGKSIAVDASGNVYSTGYFRGTVDFDPGPGTSNLSSAGFADVFIWKLDSSGGLVWARQLGDIGTDYSTGNSIAVDASGNVYTTGYFRGTVDFDPGPGTSNLSSAGSSDDIFVSKLDSSGAFVWARHLGGTSSDYSYSIALDGSGNVYTTGYFDGTADFDPGGGVSNLTSTVGYDAFIWKLDSNGTFVWARQLDGTSHVYGYSIALDGSGNVYTTGYFYGTADFDPGGGVSNLTSAGSADIFVSKLDSSGTFVWVRQLSGTDWNEGRSIGVDPAGNVYTTGRFTGTADFDPGLGASNLTSAGNEDVFVSKLDSSGTFVWARQLGGTSVDYSYSIAVDSAGNVYTTGRFKGTADFDPGTGTSSLISTGNDDIFISKLDSSGAYVWAQQLGGTDYDSGNSIALGASCNVYTTGRFTNTVDFDPGPGTSNLTSAGPYSAFILKLSGPDKFTASDAEANDLFGFGASISGDTAIFGAPGENGGAGSAYVYTRSGGVWTEQQKLTAGDAAADDAFGTSVAVSGNTVIVGSPADDDAGGQSGSAYVFTRSGGIWTQQQKLVSSDAVANDWFGYSVALSGDTALVGAYIDTAGAFESGSAYVFTRSGGVWTEQQKLFATPPGSGAAFGISVSLSGDTALIGAYVDSTPALQGGVAYVYTRSGEVWTEQQKLIASDAAADDRFGRSVSVSGDIALIGAYRTDDDGNSSGSAYVFTRSSGVWSEQQILTASDAAADDQFGVSVSLSGETALIGANLNDDGGGDAGSAYLFTRSGGMWSEDQKFTACDATAGDQFGVSVSLSGDTAIVGAYHDDDDGGDSGSAYFYSLDSDPPNATTITPATVGPTNLDTVDFTVTFDEDVQNFGDASDVVVTHSGTSSTGVSISGGPSVYTVSVTGIIGTGSFTLAVDTGSDVRDLVGNALASSVTSTPVTIDNTPPILFINSPSGTPTNSSGTVSYDLWFLNGASSVNLLSSNVTINHSGTAGGTVNIVGGTTSTPTIEITGVTGDGGYTISISAGIASDALGNESVPALVVWAVSIDNTPPSVIIGAPTGAPTNSGGTVSFPVTVNDASSVNLLSGNVTINHSGTAGGIVNIVDGTTSTPTVEITGVTGDGSYTIGISAGIAADAVGNGSAATGLSAPVTIDNTNPSATLSTGDGDPTNMPITVNVLMTEASTNFDATDLTLSNATSSAFTGGGTAYSFTLTPTVDGPFSVSIAANVFTNAVGTDNIASNVLSGTYDATEPVFTNLSVVPSEAEHDETVEISFDGSEVLAYSPDVTVNGNPAVSAKGADYSYLYTVRETDAYGPATITIMGVDTAGNLGAMGNNTALTIVAPVAAVPLAAWPAGMALLALGALALRRRK